MEMNVLSQTIDEYGNLVFIVEIPLLPQTQEYYNQLVANGEITVDQVPTTEQHIIIIPELAFYYRSRMYDLTVPNIGAKAFVAIMKEHLQRLFNLPPTTRGATLKAQLAGGLRTDCVIKMTTTIAEVVNNAGDQVIQRATIQPAPVASIDSGQTS